VATGPTRRAVLAGSAAIVSAATAPLLSGCRGVQALGPPPAPAPDIRLLRSAIAAERLLVAKYRAATRDSGPSLAVLAGLLAEHEQHLDQLSARLIEPGQPPQQPPQPSPAATGPGAVVAGQGSLVASPAAFAAAVAALAADEQAAATRLSTWLLAVPPSLAQLMASISASEATHVPVLDALRRAR
jgi:hypothetical protein